MNIGFENITYGNLVMLCISIIISVTLSVIAAHIALYRELSLIRERKLRDRYWNYLKSLISKKDLEIQTYNICLFAKNPQIGIMAKDFLKHKNLNNADIEKMISLMRRDLGLTTYKD